MRESLKALALVLAACGDPKDKNDTSWAKDSATPPVELTTTPCEDMGTAKTVDVGATEVPALCLAFTTETEATLNSLSLQDAYSSGMVDDRAGHLVDTDGTALSSLEDTNLSGELRFEGLAINLPAGSTTEVWLNLNVGNTAGNYQAVLSSPDNLVTDPAGLQPGGTYPFSGTDITIQ